MYSRDARTWMWAEACEMLEQAQRLHRQFFRFGGVAGALPSWEPPTDVVASEGEVRITVALPGVPPEQVRVGVENGVLLISAVRPPPIDGRTRVIHRLEIPYGRFERRIALPAGHYEITEERYAHGCLALRLART